MKIVSIKRENDQVTITTDAGHQVVFPASREDCTKIIPANGYFCRGDLRQMSELVSEFSGWSLNDKKAAVVPTDEREPGTYGALDTNDDFQLVAFVPVGTAVEGFPVTRISRVERADIWVETVK